MIDWIAIAVGALMAIVYVGFFAFKVSSVPLTIIVVVCLGCMLYSFYSDTREANTNHRNG